MSWLKRKNRTVSVSLSFSFCFLLSCLSPFFVLLFSREKAPCPLQLLQQPPALRARPPSLPFPRLLRLPPRKRPPSPSLPRRHRGRRHRQRPQRRRRPRRRARPRSRKRSTDSKGPGPCLRARAPPPKKWSSGASALRSRGWTRAWGSWRRAGAFFFSRFFLPVFHSREGRRKVSHTAFEKNKRFFKAPLPLDQLNRPDRGPLRPLQALHSVPGPEPAAEPGGGRGGGGQPGGAVGLLQLTRQAREFFFSLSSFFSVLSLSLVVSPHTSHTHTKKYLLLIFLNIRPGPRSSQS